MLGLSGHTHGTQCPRDLLRRPKPAEHVRDHRPERAVGVQFVGRPGGLPTLHARALRRARSVTRGRCVTPELPAQGGRIAPQHRANLPKTLTLLPQRSQRHSLFGLQLSISFRHPYTLPVGEVLHFRLETARFICLGHPPRPTLASALGR